MLINVKTPIIWHFNIYELINICSTQKIMKYQLLIKTEMLESYEISCFQNFMCSIYHAHKCQNANIFGHFNIYELMNFMLNSTKNEILAAHEN